MKSTDRPAKKTINLNDSFINEVKQIVAQARRQAYTAINSAMVKAYWEMGKRIVEEEQQGQARRLWETTSEIAIPSVDRRIRKRFFCWFIVLLQTILSHISGNIRYTVANIAMVSLQKTYASSRFQSTELVSERGIRTNVELSHS